MTDTTAAGNIGRPHGGAESRRPEAAGQRRHAIASSPSKSKIGQAPFARIAASNKSGEKRRSWPTPRSRGASRVAALLRRVSDVLTPHPVAVRIPHLGTGLAHVACLGSARLHQGGIMSKTLLLPSLCAVAAVLGFAQMIGCGAQPDDTSSQRLAALAACHLDDGTRRPERRHSRLRSTGLQEDHDLSHSTGESGQRPYPLYWESCGSSPPAQPWRLSRRL